MGWNLGLVLCLAYFQTVMALGMARGGKMQPIRKWDVERLDNWIAGLGGTRAPRDKQILVKNGVSLVNVDIDGFQGHVEAISEPATTTT
ncbi:hypothetical protein DDE82_005257 [Stemphylium lycopersici]|nr:hypothetical protein DDE82_005257 [Stemphylium lycopersici]